jgi:hypothetical protein
LRSEIIMIACWLKDGVLPSMQVHNPLQESAMETQEVSSSSHSNSQNHHKRWEPARRMWASNEPLAKIAYYYGKTHGSMLTKIADLRKQHPGWFPPKTAEDQEMSRKRQEVDVANGWCDYSDVMVKHCYRPKHVS